VHALCGREQLYSVLMLVIEQEQYLSLPGGYTQREGILKTISQ